mmetsp:Transcript_31867/g.58359  ORF Transcript_31867/g.58359 Transcript_31867/m.58359 type:complete len:246 (-) Transcript_31867:47-784(-)
MVDLGCMKIPLSGNFSMVLATGGILWGCLLVTLVFCLSEQTGPAVYKETGKEFAEACSSTLLVTCVWCLIYYNYLGVAVMCVFCGNAFEMFDPNKDVTDKFGTIAGRFQGNMFEQAPVHLLGLWMYTLFVDYTTGANLGALYIVGRIIYPFFYMVNRQFTMWFEFCTQIGYGVNGVFIIGTAAQAAGWDWIGWAKGAPIAAAITGFFCGSLAVFPALPLGPLYTFIHYKYDHKVACPDSDDDEDL